MTQYQCRKTSFSLNDWVSLNTYAEKLQKSACLSLLAITRLGICDVDVFK